MPRLRRRVCGPVVDAWIVAAFSIVAHVLFVLLVLSLLAGPADAREPVRAKAAGAGASEVDDAIQSGTDVACRFVDGTNTSESETLFHHCSALADFLGSIRWRLGEDGELVSGLSELSTKVGVPEGSCAPEEFCNVWNSRSVGWYLHELYEAVGESADLSDVEEDLGELVAAAGDTNSKLEQLHTDLVALHDLIEEGGAGPAETVRLSEEDRELARSGFVAVKSALWWLVGGLLGGGVALVLGRGLRP